ncbi:MAG: hypothetical protein ABI882_23780 [Acidobacteriota bacterium]
MISAPQQQSSGLEPNIAAVLSYLIMIPPITPVIMLMVEKEDRFVRYHAIQGLLLGLVCLIGIFGLEMIAKAAGHIARPLELLLNLGILLSGLGAFGLWVWLLLRAYQGKSVKIPIIGDEAARRVISEG